MVLHTPARSIFDQRQHRSEIVGKCPIQPALRQSPLPRALIQNIYRERRRKPARVTALSKDWGTSGCKETVLIADIGGTNCRFELWRIDSSGGKNHQELYHRIFPTKAFETFPDALEAVAQEEVFQTNTPSAAAFACAGPVASNKCEMTNLDWTIDGDYLSATHGIRMAVLNDFEANGYGVTALDEKHVVVLNDVLATEKGPKAVLGPGTGLGEAQLFWDEIQGGYKVWPSEGSHSGFAPRGWKQRALQAFVEREEGNCEVEYVACGSGLERIYRFLQSDEGCNRPTVDLETLQKAPEVTKAALDGSDPLAVEAVDLFLAIIGAEAGYLGLRALATGGVYLCGGITPKLISKIQDHRSLLSSYLHKESRFHKLLKTFPLYAVTHERTGLIGTREYAIRLLGQPSLIKAT